MILAVCGYGDHGKGTIATYLSLKTKLRYVESTSEAASRLVMFDVLRNKYGLGYESPQAAWHDRRNHRTKWAEEIWGYNNASPDGLRLYHDVIPDNDILEGVRKAAELHRLRDYGIVDLVVWVDAIKRKPRESSSSCQISAADCDIILDNNGSMMQLKLTLDTFIDNYLSAYKK